ncbi:MAG TPA: septum formation initiator family protein [Gemmatimonadaceae bacterium]|nr:septum formation initiator family protein [Gemmatimonadaceae bacterium]
MSPRKSKKMSPGRKRAWRILGLVVLVTAIVFAIQGGEYGTTDLFQQRSRKADLLAAIDTLEKQVDSLERVKKSIESDPVVQERIAREEFGLIRGDKEILYRFAEPREDSDR